MTDLIIEYYNETGNDDVIKYLNSVFASQTSIFLKISSQITGCVKCFWTYQLKLYANFLQPSDTIVAEKLLSPYYTTTNEIGLLWAKIT